MSPKRVLIAGLFHETHTFLDGTTGMKDFAVMRGDEMLRCEGDSSPLGGALECAREFGWKIIPTVDYRATPTPSPGASERTGLFLQTQTASPQLGQRRPFSVE